MTDAFNRRYPPLASWSQSIDATFYAPPEPMTPSDRERCLIAMLTCTGAALPLGIHMYWGLMEGLSLNEIASIAALAAVYAGVPKLVTGFAVMEIVAKTLRDLGEGDALGPAQVVAALVTQLPAHRGS